MGITEALPCYLLGCSQLHQPVLIDALQAGLVLALVSDMAQPFLLLFFDSLRLVTQQENRLVRLGELLIQVRERLASTDGLLDAGAGLRAVQAGTDNDTRGDHDDYSQERSYTT